jgi:raffinose/stachyose/melibiose transport system permease protein
VTAVSVKPSAVAAPPLTRPVRRRGPRDRAARVAAAVLLWGYAAVALVPLIVMVLDSLRPNAKVLGDPLGLPTSPTFESYRIAWSQASFATYVQNSALVTIAAVVLC